MDCRFFFFFFSSRRRHTRCSRDWSSDVCSSDLARHLHGILDFLAEIHPAAHDAGHDDLALGGLGRLGHERERLRPEIGRASCGKSVDLGGRRIIKKKKEKTTRYKMCYKCE